jgi:L-ascorbate metabolism protein UlaG (beta-lactamase superfamily)
MQRAPLQEVELWCASFSAYEHFGSGDNLGHIYDCEHERGEPSLGRFEHIVHASILQIGDFSPSEPSFCTLHALMHLGGVRFPVTGPVRYTMTARDVVELCRLIRPRTVVPVHYEGWKHFRQGRDAIERELANASEDIRQRFRWLPVGVEVEIAA